ncbi:hypothetical protein PHMEG_00019915 [Phytophthora megakarya]|uniref:Uncharacterized protein n=1 Tax=Phytophthora megakarya TaxID=4795 RepID=A0A225VQC6_9STRA|nr:hypothetical protein PHMEG_00019915 [Phytophthora megakarya]
MESIRSSDRGSNWEYDPDDIDFPAPAQAAVATAASGSTGSTMIQRVRISAISDLKESDESPLDYLYRLNGAGLRARLKIKDRNARAPLLLLQTMEKPRRQNHYVVEQRREVLEQVAVDGCKPTA